MRSAHSTGGREAAAKLAALAAVVVLSIAFWIASMMSPVLTLGQLLMTHAPDWMAGVAHAEHSSVSLWVWDYIGLPLMLRPAWMIPTMLGLVLAGLALQLRWGSKR